MACSAYELSSDPDGDCFETCYRKWNGERYMGCYFQGDEMACTLDPKDYNYGSSLDD